MNIRTVHTIEPNFKLIPITLVNTDEEYNNLVKEYKDKGYNKIIRTKSKGVSYKTAFNGPSYDSLLYGSCFELTIYDELGWRRIQRRRDSNIEDNISGTQAYNKLTKDIQITDINEQIPDLDKWYQKRLLGPYEDITFEGVNHIDINSAFPYYLQLIHPEFKERINYHFNNRKVDKTSKAIMNYGIGLMRRKFPNTWKKIMHLVNDRLIEETNKIDGVILAYNTDGIWFKGEYNGYISTKLGGVKQDHTNCTIRFKSAGNYEYIEDGIYNTASSGIKKELLKEWGDIYKYHPKAKLLNNEYIEEIDYEYN